MGFGRNHHNRGVGVLPLLVRTLVWIAFLGVFVAGCSLAAITRPDQYTVKRGDTLYSVARRYELSWREVASWNNIRAPYTLTPGQVLSLDRYPPVAYPKAGNSKSSPKVVKKKQPASRAPATPRTKKVTRTRPPKPPPIVHDKSKKWRWPSNGSVLRTYEQTEPRHGIDIGGALGDSIVAAETGRVVYSGAGLKGYGKLVIIKHDERFLTAYGFNRKVFVSQGDTVKAGQKIAEMGVGPRNENMLHFELRQDGQPVDPQRLLPRR